MKNALLFVFGTLMVLFGATTVLLYLKVEDNLLNKDGGLLSTSSDRSSSSLSPTQAEKNFRGQIFVVTRGGESVPLGGVIVSFYPSKQFQDLLPSIYQKIGKDVAELVPVFEAKVKAEEVAYQAYKKMTDKADTTSTQKLMQGLNAFSKKKSERDDAYFALLLKTNVQIYVNALPKPYLTAQTAPDGKFNLASSADNPLVATACASRLVGEKLEQYCWFITMDGSKEVFLNNHNMFGLGSPDSAVPMPDLPRECNIDCAKNVEVIKEAYGLFPTASTP